MCPPARAAVCQDDVGFGLGWEVFRFGDASNLTHTGMDDGVFTQGYFNPDSGSGTVVFSSGSNDAQLVLPILDAIGEDLDFVDFLHPLAQLSAALKKPVCAEALLIKAPELEGNVIDVSAECQGVETWTSDNLHIRRSTFAKVGAQTTRRMTSSAVENPLRRIRPARCLNTRLSWRVPLDRLLSCVSSTM